MNDPSYSAIYTCPCGNVMKSGFPLKELRCSQCGSWVRRRVHVFLIGPMAAGKTSIADQLAKEYGYRKYSLAAPIKQEAAAEVPNWNLLSKAEQRAHLQQIGAKFREQEPNPVLALAEQALEQTEQDGVPLVIDDGRIVEESEWAVAHGFFVVKVLAPREVRLARLLQRDGALPEEGTERDKTETEGERAGAHLALPTHLYALGELARTIMSSSNGY